MHWHKLKTYPRLGRQFIEMACKIRRELFMSVLWFYFILFFLCLKQPHRRKLVFAICTSVTCIAVGGSSWHQWRRPAVLSRRFASCRVSVRALNTAEPKNATTDFISINGFCEEHNPERRGKIFSRNISSYAAKQWGKNESDYCNTVLKSHFCFNDHWATFPTGCVHFCLYFIGNGGRWVGGHGELRVDQSAFILFFFFNL